jgi:hypothetical protein
MKANRITSFVVVTLALLLLLGQSIGGAKAAPPAKYSASISAQVGAAAAPAANKGDKPAPPAHVNDQSPLDFTIQGQLTDATGNPITTATAVTFNLYNVPSGGTAELTRSATITPDANGLFTYSFVVDTTANFNNVLLFESKQYLGITVGSDAEMTPRFELSASPYAMSLAPGAEIAGNFDYSTNTDNGLLNLFNTNTTSSDSAGLYATGPTAVWGEASSNSGNASYGGRFLNYQSGSSSSSQYGVYARASNGYGLYAESDGPGGTNQPAWSILATDGTQPPNRFTPAGGVAFNGATNGTGWWGIAPGYNGTGVLGDAYNEFVGTNGDPSAIGVYADSYNAGNSARGLQVKGSGYASGGFSGPNFSMVVKYDGSDDLHAGDILALDGNNTTLDAQEVLGVVKANAQNAAAAIGVAAYRAATVTDPTIQRKGEPATQRIYIDDQATSIKPGDLVEIVTAGQTRVRVSGAVSIGERIGIAADGQLAPTRSSADSIGKVAGKADANGMVTVVVNFK